MPGEFLQSILGAQKCQQVSKGLKNLTPWAWHFNPQGRSFKMLTQASTTVRHRQGRNYPSCCTEGTARLGKGWGTCDDMGCLTDILHSPSPKPSPDLPLRPTHLQFSSRKSEAGGTAPLHPKPSVSSGLCSSPPTPHPIHQQILLLDFQKQPQNLPPSPHLLCCPWSEPPPSPSWTPAVAPHWAPSSCFGWLQCAPRMAARGMHSNPRPCHLKRHPSMALSPLQHKAKSFLRPQGPADLAANSLPLTLLQPPWPPSRSTEVPVHTRTPGLLHWLLPLPSSSPGLFPLLFQSLCSKVTFSGSSLPSPTHLSPLEPSYLLTSFFPQHPLPPDRLSRFLCIMAIVYS